MNTLSLAPACVVTREGDVLSLRHYGTSHTAVVKYEGGDRAIVKPANGALPARLCIPSERENWRCPLCEVACWHAIMAEAGAIFHLWDIGQDRVRLGTPVGHVIAFKAGTSCLRCGRQTPAPGHWCPDCRLYLAELALACREGRAMHPCPVCGTWGCHECRTRRTHEHRHDTAGAR